MVKIEFAQDWAKQFECAGLGSFEDFFDYKSGRTINNNQKRDVVLMELSLGSGRKEFFMKRFFNPHFKDMLFTLRNFGSICSQAMCEWRNANILLENGVQTYRPVCYGERKVLGLEQRSFFVTEKLSGQCLTDFLATTWAQFEQTKKEKFLAGLAEFVRRIHDACVSLPDLYVWHIFVTKEKAGDSDTEYEFAVIDLHRMRINVTSRAERARNLGALDFSMLEKYFDDDLRRRFLDCYISGWKSSDKESFLRSVERRSALLAGRRKQPIY